MLLHSVSVVYNDIGKKTEKSHRNCTVVNDFGFAIKFVCKDFNIITRQQCLGYI